MLPNHRFSLITQLLPVCLLIPALSLRRPFMGCGVGKRMLRSSMRTFSTVPSTSDEMVRLTDGTLGKVLTRKGGWVSVQLTTSNEIVKLRKSEFVAVADANTLTITESELPDSSLNTNVSEPSPPKLTFPPIENLVAPPIHAQYKKWIIFSDLHVKASSIDTCEQVLDQVHLEAVQRDAGIIFLGDFWHVRGALSVELLNRVLKCFQRWHQPVIMIPGNHDQVTLGGAVHALEPLKYAFRPENILMINEPSICLGALWIPYRRSSEHMKYILGEAWQRSDEISAIFCHTDVKGAWMNDNMQSREGIDVHLFPPNMPIFSGHFHKPHSVAFSHQSLRYVGSPYQTSLSEADQVKFLYEVELQSQITGREMWREKERWPVSVGKKFYKVDSPRSEKLHLLKSGDKIVIQCQLEDQAEVDAVARRLKEQGIEVEVRETQRDQLFVKTLLSANSELSSSQTVAGEDGASETVLVNASGDIVSAEGSDPRGAPESERLLIGFDDIDPLTLFTQYMESVSLTQFSEVLSTLNKTANGTLPNVSSNDVALDIKSRVIEEGKATIAQLLHNKAGLKGANNQTKDQGGGSETLSVLNADHRNLILDSLHLRNFGPYGGSPVHYPLSQRGLVLLRGQTLDNTGADSNGSGKTTLAMSILWCLTGSMDTRLINDGRSYDVTFDAPTSSSANLKRTAEVRLQGRINNKSFELIRRKGTKKQELLFFVDGQDLTNQAVKDTQAVVDAWLGLQRGILQRCYFFGQHSHTAQSLLGLTDTRLKEELSPLLNMVIWTSSTADVRSREKLTKQELQENDILHRLAQQDVAKVTTMQAQLQIQQQGIQQELNATLQARAALRLQPDSSNSSVGAPGLRSLEQLDNELRFLEDEKKRIESRELEPRRESLMSLLQSMNADNLNATSSQQPFTAIGRRNSNSSFNSHNTTSSSIAKLSEESSENLQKRLSMLRARWEMAEKDLRIITETLNVTIPKETHALKGLINQSIAAVTTIAAAPTVSESLTPALTLSLAKLLSATIVTESSLAPLMQDVHLLQEDCLGQLGSIDEQIKGVNASLVKLRDNADSMTPSHVHLPGDNCPTCGQLLPQADKAARKTTLQNELRSLLQQRQKKAQQKLQLQGLLDSMSRLQIVLPQQHALHDRVKDLQAQERSQRQQLQANDEERILVEAALETQQAEAQERRNALQARITQLQGEIAQAQQQLRALDQQLQNLHVEQQRTQKALQEIHQQESLCNVTIAQLESKLQYTQGQWREKSDELLALTTKADDLAVHRRALLDRSLVLAYLQDFFGPRGIQHYLFQSVIDRLEFLANTYLNILSDGGMKLQLKSDVDAEKIVKYVLVRGGNDDDSVVGASEKNGSPVERGYRERGLAQLSGGQWRRVSLAMDFAFTECVQRRGLLQCNVLVLDEILTHLDGQGREAVGSLLKAMVKRSHEEGEEVSSFGSSEDARKQLRFVDGYGTIIVILQDLVASEIEEAFDHIDVVRKEGDVSSVLVDE